ncbi:MAG: hypothetical protein NXY57DRAFT_968517 [Lentinula lateritia]|nr:MAG: hypothetical protein NXY57DRAFT_968517 [Lentinula lateritia]
MLEAADKMSLPQRPSSQGPNTVFSNDAASNPMAPPLEKPKRGRGSRGGKSTTQSKGRKTSSEQPPTPKSLPTISPTTISPTTVSPTSGYPPPLPSMGRQVPLPSKAPISEAIRREQSDINHNQFNSSFFQGWTTQDFSNSVVTVPGGNAPLGLEENRTNLHLPDDIWGGGRGRESRGTQGVEDFSRPFAPGEGNLGYRSTGPSDIEPSYNNQYGWGQRGNYRESYENYGADNRGGGYRRNYHEGNFGMQDGGYEGNLGNQGRDYGGSYGGFYGEGYKGPDSGYGGYNRGLYQNFGKNYLGGRGYDHFSQSHSLQGFIKDDRGIKGLEVAESARTGFQEATHLGTAQGSEVAQRGVSSITEKLREPTAEGRSFYSYVRYGSPIALLDSEKTRKSLLEGEADPATDFIKKRKRNFPKPPDPLVLKSHAKSQISATEEDFEEEEQAEFEHDPDADEEENEESLGEEDSTLTSREYKREQFLTQTLFELKL